MNIALWVASFLSGGILLGFVVLSFWFRQQSLQTLNTAISEGSIKVSVIVPCRGLDHCMPENLNSILQQIYPNYEVIFATSSLYDASIPVLKELTSKYPDQTKLIIASPSGCRSDKVNNQLAALRQLDPQSQVIVFFDSDGYATPEFLSRLLVPLYSNDIVATTGYRWFYPKKPTVVNSIAVLWGGLSLLLQSVPTFTLIWGGAMAIKRKVFEQLEVEEAWQDALSDDNVLGLLLRRAKLKTIFVPSAIVLSQANFNWYSFFRWGRRQFFFLRVALFWDWFFILTLSIFITFGPIVTFLLLGSSKLYFRPGFGVTTISLVGLISALWLLVFYWAVTGGEDLGRQAGHNPVTMPRRQLILGMLMPWILLSQLIASAFGRKVTWRGVVYQATAYNKTRILHQSETNTSLD